METTHLAHTRPTTPEERPPCLPRLSADDFCKAKYSYHDKRCYTARMLDVFLRDEEPYVAAYREFRLASMDYMYRHHTEHPAQTQIITRDIAVGVIKEEEWSGLITPAQKAELLDKVETIGKAIRSARSRANEAEVDRSKVIGHSLLSYIFG